MSQVTSTYFHPVTKQRKSKHYHLGVMQQLPSVILKLLNQPNDQHLSPNASSPLLNILYYCWVNRSHHFFCRSSKKSQLYFALIHLLEGIHRDADVFLNHICCLYPHFSHNLCLYVFVEFINILLVQIHPLSLATYTSIVLSWSRV